MKRTVLSLLAIACCATLLDSQNPSYRWLRDAGHHDIGGIQAVAGQNGDVFALISRPSGITVEHYDSSGVLHWSRQAPNIWKITATYNNEVLLSGHITGPVAMGSATLSGAPDKERVLILLDENGNVVSWDNHEDYYTGIHELEPTPSGDIFVKGMLHDTLELFGYTIVNPTSAEYTHFVMKLSSTLQPQWHYFLNISPSQNFGDMVVHDNKIYLTGTYKDTIAIGSNIIYSQLGSTGSFILRFDSQGQVTWHKVLPETSINRLHFDVKGNLYVHGGYEDTLSVGSLSITTPACNHNSCWNNFALKMDPSGNPLYLTALGQDHNSTVNYSAVTPGGRFYFTGEFYVKFLIGADSLYLGEPWRHSLYLAALDGQGALDWSVVPQKQDFSVGTYLSVHGDGNLYWSGFAKKLVINNDSVECTDAYNSQNFIARYKGTGLATELHQAERDQFTIWPNPSQGHFNIESTNPGKTEFMILDIMGVCIHRFVPKQRQVVVSTDGMAPGVYLIIFNDGTVKSHKKIVIN